MTSEVDAPLDAPRIRTIYDRLGAHYDLLLEVREGDGAAPSQRQLRRRL